MPSLEMAQKDSSIDQFTCLRDLLQERSGSKEGLTFYPLGNTSTPRKLTYGELFRLAQENGKLLARVESFQEGHPVLIHLSDHWDVILWFWSVLLANGLPVLSTPFSNVDEHRRKHVQALSNLLESPLCITRREFLPLFRETGHKFALKTIEDLPSWDNDDNPATDFLDGPFSNKSHGSCRGASPAMLMLTSGSTGNAKAVVLTHHQVLASVAGKTLARNLSPGRPFLNWIGLDHVGAFVEIHMHALWANTGQVHVHAADIVSSPTTFLYLLSRHRVSRSFAPNFFLASLVASADAVVLPQGDLDLSDLSFLVSGGEANDVKTCIAASKVLEKYGASQGVIAPGFGMTETCAGCIYNTDCPQYDVANGYDIASLGKCIVGMEMRVVLDQASQGDTICPVPASFEPVLAQPNQPGFLEVRGDMVFRSYYRNPTATAEAISSDGWFRTGDRAVLDTARNLRLIGRANEVFNINGVKVAVADLQASLEQASEGYPIARLIVFPSRIAHTEQITVACLEQNAPMTAREMSEFDSQLVQACMMLTGSRPMIFSLGSDRFHLLPMTTLGKVSRAKLRSLLEDGAFDVDMARWRSLVAGFRRSRMNNVGADGRGHGAMTDAEFALVHDFLAISTSESMVQAEVGADTSLWELGFTSMDVVRLKHRLDARLGLAVPMVVLMKNPTARSLAPALLKDSCLISSRPGSGQTSMNSANGNATADIDYDPVVPFRASGNKAPLWLLHPGVGEVLVFAGLAQQMSDDDRPLYALRARGFEPGETTFGSIDEAVGTYVAAIRRVQPRGPYALAGYSYGAMLAFEIAKRLDAQLGPEAQDGVAVRFLGSFNLPPHIKMRMRQLNWSMCLLHLAYFIGLTSEDSLDGDEFRGLSRDVALARVLSAADERRMRQLSMGKFELLRWVDVAYGLQSMAVDYEPAGTVASIHVFHAEPLKVVAASRDEWIRDHLARWADHSRSRPTLTQVDGAHYTMLGSEHVGEFAKRLKEALKAGGL